MSPTTDRPETHPVPTNVTAELQLSHPGRIGVIGCGYLGAVHAACLAHWGFDVIGVDTSAEKVAALNAATAPFVEAGLDQLLATGVRAKRLRFTTDAAELAGCALVFICVGTPQLADSAAADLSQVQSAVASVCAHLEAGSVVVGKSTVPVGTAAVINTTLKDAGLRLVWNPEFLREGTAVNDTLHPDRVVLGVTDPDDVAPLQEVYHAALSAGSRLVVTDLATAEIIKEAANAFLATKISFINAVGELCEAANADVLDVAYALGLDDRIGAKFLHPGIGYGGGCFPKDVRALSHRANELGASSLAELLYATDNTNQRARQRALELVGTLLTDMDAPTSSHTAPAVRVALLGLTFKPGSDDMRDSPALWLADQLIATYPGLELVVFDPAFPEGAVVRSHKLVASAAQACADASLVVLATDWPEFRELDPSELQHAKGRFLVDLRNCVDPDNWVAAGWSVFPLGRPPKHPAR